METAMETLVSRVDGSLGHSASDVPVAPHAVDGTVAALHCYGHGDPTMNRQAILWRRLDHPGHDSALLTESSAGAVLEGSAVFGEAASPSRLDYVVMCDTHWRTMAARVTGWVGTSRVDLDVAADAGRHWTMNGVWCPQVSGCNDIDFGFSPSTNLLPIRRERLAVGERVAVCAAWLHPPSLALDPLRQTYERVSERAYCYTSHDGTFAAVLGTDESGFVTSYPGLWRQET
jgi:hypothetical protein